MSKGPSNTYIIEKEIARGTLGKVYDGMDRRDKIPIIIKKIPIQLDLGQSKEYHKSLLHFTSPYLTEYISIEKDEEYTWVIMKKHNWRSLDTYLKKRTSEEILTEEELRIILIVALVGLNELHQKNIIHGELRPSNMLYSRNDQIVLCGYGLITNLAQLDSIEPDLMTIYEYMAPEVFNGKMCTKSDIWSLGITAIELATGRNPNAGLTKDEIKNNKCTLSSSLSSGSWSDSFKDFVNSCLEKDVNKRLSAAELLKHQFICGDDINQDNKYNRIKCIHNCLYSFASSSCTSQTTAISPRTSQTTTISPRTSQTTTISPRTSQTTTISPRTSQVNTISPHTSQTTTISPRASQTTTSTSIKDISKFYEIDEDDNYTLPSGIYAGQFHSLELITSISTHVEWTNLSDTIIMLKIEKGCNASNFTVVDFTKFKELKTVDIGDHCFCNATNVIFSNMTKLERINIGYWSFTQQEALKWPKRKNNTFQCCHNPQLQSITIDAISFSEYNEFKLEDLPSLESIEIGKTNEVSCNFFYADFVLKDLIHLKDIQLGVQCFAYSVNTQIENLLDLSSIQLGFSSLWGDSSNKNCSLTMKNLPVFVLFVSMGCSFKNPYTITLENIPNLMKIDIPFSFSSVKKCIYKNISSLFEKYIPNDVNNQGLHLYYRSMPYLTIPCGKFEISTQLDINTYRYLQELRIGEKNFINQDFVLQDFECLKYLEISVKSYQFSCHTVIKNLPMLKHIRLLDWALQGKDDEECSLELNNLPSLISLVSYAISKASFENVRSVVFENIPNIKSVILPKAFRKVKSTSIHHVAPCLESLVTK